MAPTSRCHVPQLTRVALLAFFLTIASWSIVLAQDQDRVANLLDSAYAMEGQNPDSAILIYKEVYRLSEKAEYLTGMAKALHYSGIVYSDKSMYPEALQHYHKAMPLYQKDENFRGVGACFTNIGNVYRFQSQLDSAVANYQRAVDIFRQHHLHDALSQAYGNVGGVFQMMQQYNKAHQYHSLSVDAAIQSKDSLILCNALINKGTVLNDLDRIEESINSYIEAMKIAKAIDNDYVIHLAYINLADHARKAKEFDRALEYGVNALHHARKLGTPYDIADVQRRVGDIYASMGNHQEARNFYLEAVTTAREINAREVIMSSYEALHRSSASLGDYHNAYDYQTLAAQYRDSVLNEKQLQIINELEVKYQTLQKDQALYRQQLELQESRQFTTYVVGISLILFLTVVILYVQYQNRKKQHAAQLERTRQEKEIHVLQALMQGEEKERTRIARALHDEVAGLLAAAKMNLDSLTNSHTANDTYRNAVVLLDEASASVRKTAHNLMPEFLMQYGLDKALRRYCDSIGRTGELTIQYDSWGDPIALPAAFELSVYRIVQELLNNVIKHARATEAIIQLGFQEGLLSVTVEDNGVGLPPDADPTDPKSNLAFLKSRVAAINGTIDITSEPGAGVSVHIEFELASEKVGVGNSINLI